MYCFLNLYKTCHIRVSSALSNIKHTLTNYHTYIDKTEAASLDKNCCHSDRFSTLSLPNLFLCSLKNLKKKYTTEVAGEVWSGGRDSHANTKFVNIVMVGKPFYMKLEKIAEELGTQSDTVVNNTLLLTLKKLEEKVETGGDNLSRGPHVQRNTANTQKS